MSNISIDPKLVKRVKEIGNYKNSAIAIEAALNFYIRKNSKPRIKGFEIRIDT